MTSPGARRRFWIAVDLLVKVALVGLLVHALANPELPQYSGKAMTGRAIAFPLAALLVPVIWRLRYRSRPFPAVVDLLFTTPFLLDVVGNALNLYDTIDWWDDANHFFNWALVTAAAALVLRGTGLPGAARLGLAAGFAAITAIGWELAEYVTFIRNSPEIVTAYRDTLGDLTFGLLGGTLGAAIVQLAERRARGRSG